MKFIILMLLLPLGVVAQDSITRKLDALVDAYHVNGHFNGSVLVAKKGTVLLQKGYGWQDAGAKLKNDVHSQFQIASITKQFTAAIILKLAEQGRLGLKDKLDKYYPGFPNGGRITIENLLTHTSGLHNFTESDSSIEETDEARIIPYLKTLKPDFAPDSGWHYSNSGYVVLGYIIQKAGGMTYWQAIRKYIFTPLNMTASGFDFTHLKGAHKAIGYDELEDSSRQTAKITDSTVPFGAGAIYSTVEDMYKWHRALQAYKIVGRSWMDQAYKPCRLNNYGYGWQIDSIYGRKEVSHSGSITGFGSNFARVTDDDLCIVVLSNKSGSAFDVMNITRKMLALLYDQPYTLPKKRRPVFIDSAILQRYAGTYEVPEIHLIVEVSIHDRILIAQPSRDGHPGSTAFVLGLDDTHFYDKHDTELEVTFNMDDAGKTKGMTILQNGTTRFAKKIK